jgi:hypothetical protein
MYLQIGDLFCKPGHMFEMARQNADIIEDETSRGQNPQPVQNLVANDPIGIRLDVYEMSYADEGPLANERIERLLHLDRHEMAERWLTLAEHAAREGRFNGGSLFRDR